MNLELPRRAFFEFACACLYRENAPKIDGKLSDWDERYLLTDLGVLDGREPFANVYAGWNDGGVYLAVDVLRAVEMETDVKRPLRGDGLQVWVDTRDVRTAHRASRYCHHFYFLPAKGSRKPVGGQVRIRRARSQGKPCDPSHLEVACSTTRSGYRMEMKLPAEVLTGFDPEENTRLGFTYLLRDRKLGRQYWTADEPLPVSYDPSLWGTLELVR
ncbi:MAG: hypothetical protein O2954_15660 [bacterium]|nr:hypothetical protein [bacterium]